MIYKNARNRNLTPSFAGKITSVEMLGSDYENLKEFRVNVDFQNGCGTFFCDLIPNNENVISLYIKDLCDTVLFSDVDVKNVEEASKLLKGASVILLYDKGGYKKGGKLVELCAGDNRHFSYKRFLENRKKLAKQEAKRNEVFNKPEY